MVTCNIIIQISLNTLAQAQREKLDVWNLFLRCGNKIQVLSHVFLKKSALYAITPEVTEINNRKYQKNTSRISSQRIIMKQNSRKRKISKNYRFKHELKITFLSDFLCLTEEVEVLGKNGGARSHT